MGSLGILCEKLYPQFLFKACMARSLNLKAMPIFPRSLLPVLTAPLLYLSNSINLYSAPPPNISKYNGGDIGVLNRSPGGLVDCRSVTNLGRVTLKPRDILRVSGNVLIEKLVVDNPVGHVGYIDADYRTANYIFIDGFEFSPRDFVKINWSNNSSLFYIPYDNRSQEVARHIAFDHFGAIGSASLSYGEIVRMSCGASKGKRFIRIVHGGYWTPPVPEPATYGAGLAAVGLGAFLLCKRRKACLARA